jgi:hypothetical protein
MSFAEVTVKNTTSSAGTQPLMNIFDLGSPEEEPEQAPPQTTSPTAIRLSPTPAIGDAKRASSEIESTPLLRTYEI